MPSVLKEVYLVQEAVTGTSARYGGTFGGGIDGWLTGLMNRTLGPVYFPRFGRTDADINNPTTVVQIDSMRALTPSDLLAVFGSPAPSLPVDLSLLVFYPGFTGDDNTDTDLPPSANAGDDADGFINGPTLPYLQLEVQYLTATPVDFSIDVEVEDLLGKVQYDSCGHAFRLVGSSVQLTAAVTNVRAAGTVTSTKFEWTIAGASLTNGSLTDPTITLVCDQPRIVNVDLRAVITTQQGSGIQVETQTTARTVSFGFVVLTPAEAAASEILCRILQETLPIRRFVFPGDPIESRVSPASLTARIERIGVQVSRLASRLNTIGLERGKRGVAK